MNDLDLCLEVVSRSLSTIASHSPPGPPNISENVVRGWGLVPTTNRKWPTGNHMVTWPMTSH